MESSSDSSDSPRRHYDPAKQLSDRITRALSHRLRLLHRAGPDFFILGATGNVYTVTLSSKPTCSCPDRAPAPCKHALFVLLRVLRFPVNGGTRYLRRKTLLRLLEEPTSPESLAGERARERFRQVFFSERKARLGTCAICLEEMEEGDETVSCGVCENSVHGRCFLEWRRRRGRRGATCVLCRGKWGERREGGGYVNIEAYVGEEEKARDGGSCSS